MAPDQNPIAVLQGERAIVGIHFVGSIGFASGTGHSVSGRSEASEHRIILGDYGYRALKDRMR
jgi:hypothetical protein